VFKDDKSDLNSAAPPDSQPLINAPPPYADPNLSSSSAAGPSGVNPLRVNHLYIIEKNASVKGDWTVDPNFRIPPLLRPKPEEGERLENIHLESYNNSVNAKLALVSDTPTKSYLFVGSHNSSSTVNIVHRVNQKFNLKIKNHNSSNYVYIPRDFQGPISFKNNNGTNVFSEAITQNLRQFGKQNGVGRAFIGDLAGYGESESDVWEGDELVVENENGRNAIYYSDEADPSGGKRGFIATLFGYTGN